METDPSWAHVRVRNTIRKLAKPTDSVAAQLLHDYHAFFRAGRFEEPERSNFVARMRSKAAAIIAEDERQQVHLQENAKTRAIFAEAEAQRQLKERYRSPMNDKV